MLDGEFPTLGAWVHYGLGSLNDNLPQFLSLGNREYWNAKDGHYLGPAHDAVPVRVDPHNPLDYGKPAKVLSVAEQQIGFELVGRLNQLKAVEYPHDPALLARIQAYELAFRMQTSVPDTMNFSVETKATQELYGLDEPASSCVLYGDRVMRIHDWSRVDDGIFHDFHHAWIEEIKRTLNGGLLPPWLYALAEQQASEFGPDVLALQAPGSTEGRDFEGGGTGLLVAPPKVKMTAQGSREFYAQKQESVVVRHASDDQIVAVVEVVSPGNKSSQQRLDSFVRNACLSLHQGIHRLVLDLHPPTRRAPEGIHGAVWAGINDDDYRRPEDKPLTLVGYESKMFAGVTAYIEPVAVGDSLPEMPLYVATDGYVLVPLQPTYDRAFAALPRRWADVLEQP